MKFVKTTCLVVSALAVGLGSCSTLSNLNILRATPEDLNAPPPVQQRISLVDVAQQVVPSPDLANVGFNLPAPSVKDEWPVPGGTLEQSVENVAAAPNFRIAWKRRVGKPSSRSQFITAPPIAADGRIYTMDAAARVTATDMATGRIVWSAVMNGRRDTRSRLPEFQLPFTKKATYTDVQTFGGGMAYANGRVYVTSGYRFIAALDAGTGAQVWRTAVPSPIHSAPTVAGGRVYSVNTNNELQTFDASTGEAGWQYQALVEQARILQASSPAVSGETVVAAFASGEMVALQAANGNELWSVPLIRASRTTALSEIRDIAGRPVVYQGDVFAGGHSGAFAAINLRTGQERWRLPIITMASAWASGDVVYTVSKAGEVICINRASGKVYWIKNLNENARSTRRTLFGLGYFGNRTYWTSVVMASNRLITVSSDGEAVALDPKTGYEISRLNLGAPAVITPIAVRGMVYVMLDNGVLVAIG